MCVGLWVCVCEYVYMYMCIYACIVIKTCGKILSTDTTDSEYLEQAQTLRNPAIEIMATCFSYVF